MNVNIQNIVEGQGLGEVKFGMTRDAVEALLGAPNEKEAFSYTEDEQDMTESWHYDELEFSLGFDAVDDWKLTTISVTGTEFTFHNFKPIGLSSEALIQKLEAEGIDDLVQEDHSSAEHPDHEVVFSESMGINFWFDENELAEVQWVPHFNDDETVQWPAL